MSESVSICVVDDEMNSVAPDPESVAAWSSAAETAGVRLTWIGSDDPNRVGEPLIMATTGIRPTPSLIRAATKIDTQPRAATVLPLSVPDRFECVVVPANSTDVRLSGVRAAVPWRDAVALRSSRCSVDEQGNVVTTAALSESARRDENESLPESPFISIVMRTRGDRPQKLREALATVSFQTDRDFEVILVAHRASPDQLAELETLLELQEGWMRDRIRLVTVEHGGRSTPLNVGFDAARGEYIAVLDDDDLVFDHYVATFRAIAQRAGDRILRARCVRLNAEESDSGEMHVDWPPTAEWPADFDLLLHLCDNHTPFMSVALPRAVFHERGRRFSENLATHEDWEFLIHAANAIGVESDPEITSVYRWWHAGTSATEHAPEDVVRDRHSVREGFAALPIHLPPGSSRRLVEGMDAINMLVQYQRANHELSQRIAHLETQAAERDREHAELQAKLESANAECERLRGVEAELGVESAELHQLRTEHRMLWRMWRARRFVAQRGVGALAKRLVKRA